MARQPAKQTRGNGTKSASVAATPQGGTATATLSQPQSKPKVNEEMVRLRAYQKWEQAGKPPGDGMYFWLEAEQEVKGGK